MSLRHELSFSILLMVVVLYGKPFGPMWSPEMALALFKTWRRCRDIMFVCDERADDVTIQRSSRRQLQGATAHGKSWNLGRPFSRPGKSWKIAKVMDSHGKSWKMMIKSWNFYYCTEQFCKSDTTSFRPIKSNYEKFYLFNNGTTSRWNCHY